MKLSPTETKLLAALREAGGAVVTREALIAQVWGETGGNTLEKTIQRLRAKIEVDPKDPHQLLTVHGQGYRLVPEAPEPKLALFGRDEVASTLRSWLAEADARVTVLGPGGIGKTALARAVVEGMDSWFVDLTGAGDARAVVGAIARALEAAPTGRTLDEARASLGEVLAHRGGVLVLDNAETAPELARTIAAWPRGRVLATSRVRLGHPRERLLDLPPLDAEASAALFAARARRPIATEALLPRLEGLPLAIELAAAWTDVLDAAGLVERLDRGDLVARELDRPARHGSLEATIATSWDMLSEPARTALAHAALFRGTFDLEAIEALLPDPIDAVQELVDRSMIQRTARAGLRRLVLADTVRAFARARLPDARATEAWRASVIERGERLVAQGVEARPRLECDLDDLLAVSREGEDVERVRAAAIGLEVVRVRGPLALVGALAVTALEAGLRLGGRWEAIARRELAFYRRSMGRLDEALAEATLAVAAAGKDIASKAAAHKALGLVLYARGAFAPAIAEGRLALIAFEVIGDERMAARTRADIAVALLGAGTPDPALEAEARAAFKRLGDVEGEARIAVLSAQRAVEAGHADLAEAEARYGLYLARSARLDGLACVCTSTLALVAWERGHIAEAARIAAQTRQALLAIGSAQLARQVLAYQGLWTAMAGDPAGVEMLAEAGAGGFLALVELQRGNREAARQALAGTIGAAAASPAAALARAILDGGPMPEGGDVRRLRRWLG